MSFLRRFIAGSNPSQANDEQHDQEEGLDASSKSSKSWQMESGKAIKPGRKDRVHVLITQCIQEDFIKEMGPNERLPNQLHVGSAMAGKLKNALEGFLPDIRNHKCETLRIFHVIDKHDENDEKQIIHLKVFGKHCVDEGGYKLAFGLQPESDAEMNPYERMVEATGLDDIQETSLTDELLELMDKYPEVHVAVIGVWTDMKVTILLKALREQLGIESLATSTDLTASPNYTTHQKALRSLQKEGVKVFGLEEEDNYFTTKDATQVGVKMKPWQELACWLHPDTE